MLQKPNGCYAMKWLLLPLLLVVLILFFGCLGPTAPAAPPYKAPSKTNDTITPPPAKNASPDTPITPPSKPLVPPKNVTKPANQTVSPPSNPANATTPQANATQNNTPPAPSSVCGGLGGSGQLECIAQAAIGQKNVLICTQLTLREDRYKCFTRWCYSGARDYKQCQALPDNDDRLGCLNKCNPNFNT